MNRFEFDCEWDDYSITTRVVWAATYADAASQAHRFSRKIRTGKWRGESEFPRRVYDNETGKQVL